MRGQVFINDPTKCEQSDSHISAKLKNIMYLNIFILSEILNKNAYKICITYKKSKTQIVFGEKTHK